MPNEELKYAAIQALAESRAEIRTEVDRVREQFKPRRVVRRLVVRYTGTIVVLAFATGFIPALWLFRGKREHPPLVITAAKPAPKPMLNALLLGGLGMLVKSVSPELIKSGVVPRVLAFVLKKLPRATR